MRLKPDSHRDPATGELVVADGGKLSAFGRGFHRLWWSIFEASENEAPALAVTDIDEVRQRKQAEVADAAAGLETSPAPVNSEGQVVDMAAHRMAQAARAEADKAHAERGSTLDEDLLKQQTGD